jgi:hypothetical protein
MRNFATPITPSAQLPGLDPEYPSNSGPREPERAKHSARFGRGRNTRFRVRRAEVGRRRVTCFRVKDHPPGLSHNALRLPRSGNAVTAKGPKYPPTIPSAPDSLLERIQAAILACIVEARRGNANEEVTNANPR